VLCAPLGTGSQTWQLEDISGELSGTAIAERDISDTMQDTFRSMVPDNIVAAMASPDIVSVLMFGIFFGIGVSTLKVDRGEENLVLKFFMQLNEIIFNLLKMIIRLTPLALISLLAGALQTDEGYSELFSNVGILVAAVILALFVHMFVTLPGIYYAFVRENPYTWMKAVSPAMTFAIASSSSAATLPVTIDCVRRTNKVPFPIAKFVLSLGSTLNMDGAAVYYPCAIVYLAYMAGRSDELTAALYITIVIASTIGATGASPIPNLGLVVLVTIWDAAFPGVEIPPQVSYVLAIDAFILDRLETCSNVTGDTFIARVIAATMPAAKPDAS